MVGVVGAGRGTEIRVEKYPVTGYPVRCDRAVPGELPTNSR